MRMAGASPNCSSTASLDGSGRRPQRNTDLATRMVREWGCPKRWTDGVGSNNQVFSART